MRKAYRVYGAYGHRQRYSFFTSEFGDFSKGEARRTLAMLNADITGTNDYTIIVIERNTAEEVEAEFFGQLSDGVFENCRTGYFEEIPITEEIEKAVDALQR